MNRLRLGHRWRPKHADSALDGWPPLARNLVGVDTVFLPGLGNCLAIRRVLNGHLGLERRCIVTVRPPSQICHSFVPDSMLAHLGSSSTLRRVEPCAAGSHKHLTRCSNNDGIRAFEAGRVDRCFNVTLQHHLERNHCGRA